MTTDTPVEIRSMIAQQLEVKMEKVTENANLAEDLGADSIDLIGLISSMEEKFDIHIPDEDSSGIKTVKDLILYTEKKIEQK